MNARELNEVVGLAAKLDTRKPSGQMVSQFASPTGAFAKVEYLSSKVYTAALAEQTGCELRVTIRQRSLATGSRLWHLHQPFAVKTITPHQTKGFIVLMCEKDDGNG